MFLKLLGSILIVLGTSVVGYMMAGVYKERVKQLRKLQYSLHSLESEIVYSSTNLVHAFAKLSEQNQGALRKLFDSMSRLLRERRFDTVSEAFLEASKGVSGELYIEKEEKETLLSFMQSLGSSDMEGQKKNFNLTLKKLEEYEKRAEEVRVKNEKLYRYLGVSLGAFIVIILV
jgi:stage III sporulation protein AB